MIRKIISGGQEGVERAALDAALKLNIAHGGWVPYWREEEDRALTRTYRLQAMRHGNFVLAALQNVLDSDGVLIISQGEPSGNSALNRRLAEKHRHPWIYIDLDRVSAFDAARQIEAWIADHGVEVLNVTGPTKSRRFDLYKTTLEILETVFQLVLVEPRRYEYNPLAPAVTGTESRLAAFISLPRSVTEAVEILLDKLTFQERSRIANMDRSRLASLSPSLGMYIKNEFRMWKGNDPLMDDCRLLSDFEDEEPAAVIIRELWKHLQDSDQVLRVVK
ncbi:MAG: YpsA SLOG family protein [Thermodesulfobacteriota bacterium]